MSAYIQILTNCRGSRAALMLLFLLGNVAVFAQGLVRDDAYVPVQVKLFVEPGRLVASNVRLSRLDEVLLAADEAVVASTEAAAVILVVTDRRFLGYGPVIGWRELERLPGESPGTLTAVDYAGFVATSERLLNFNARTGIWAAESRSSR